jgi:hypothetical protein
MNTATQVGIYNMALAGIGVSRFVNAIDEGTVETNVLNVFWNITRDQVLQAFPWDFAMRYVQLQTINKQVPGWVFVYASPSDSLQNRLIIPYWLMQVNGGGFVNFWELYRSKKRIPFVTVENEAAGGLAIATNEQQAWLAYTARINTIQLWSPAFVNALTWLLASKIVAPLAASPTYAQTAGAAYQHALLEAGALSMNEGEEKPEPESEFIEARY